MKSMLLAAFAALTLAAPTAQAGCGPSNDACEIPLGQYHIALPPDVTDPAEALPVVIFLHGAGGSGEASLRNSSMVNAVLDRGYAFIAPDGSPREGRFGTGWNFHPDFPQGRDELVFMKQVVTDAASRFHINPDRVLLAGFSVGGSMVTYLACRDPNAFAAFAPVAGSFWRPHPTSCAGPVRLFHTHGWRDTTVPLEGRPLRNGTLIQGDVFHAMEIWRDTNGCKMMRPDSFSENGVFWRRKWTDCTPGSALEFALHPGAHGVPNGWAPMVLDWFEALHIEDPVQN